MKIRIIFLFGFLFSTLVLAQLTTFTGNLLRIDLTKPEINFKDTLWHWTNKTFSNGSITERCLSVIKIGGTEYLSTLITDDNPYLPKNYSNIYNCSTKFAVKILEDFPPIDPEIFWYNAPVSLNANNGMWLFYGIRRSAIFVRGDSIYDSKAVNNLTPIHLCGKIGDKYFIIIQENNKYDFSPYAVDFKNSPKIDFGNKLTIANEIQTHVNIPTEIFHLRDSLLIFKYEANLLLGVLSSDKIKLIKEIAPKNPNPSQMDFRQWHVADDYLFYKEKNKLYKEKYDYVTNSFQGKTLLIDTIPSGILFGSYYTFSNDDHYFAYFFNDSLCVYSLLEQKEVYKHSLKSINHTNDLIIDWPYAYLHQVRTVTGIENKKELPVEFSLSQNYPNPFNPETTIRYKVQATSLVILKVYDLLGREVATLLDEIKPPGTFSVEFRSQNKELSSGIYFYTLRSGQYNSTKKMILMK